VYRQRETRGPIAVRSFEGPLRVATDGETFTASERFEIAKAPDRLAVFVPPD
jgi:hypothetical protein